MKRAQLVKDILLKENITTWFQPVVNLEKGDISGWEALTRGPSVSTLHSAAALFAAAQKAELLKPLELMCIRNATKCFEQLQLGGKLFVNISHDMLLAGNVLREQLKALISNGPVPTSKIVLEMTERDIVAPIEKLVEAVNFFHQLGFQFALDDVGAGQSSPEQWAALRPDYVKVDRHFVNGIDEDSEKQQFVRSVVANARSLKAKVIAEGVETRRELNCLRELGIHKCQGYLFQRPELAPVSPDLSAVLAKPDTRSLLQLLACDLIMTQAHVEPDTALDQIQTFFNNDPALSFIAVVDHGEVLGLVSRLAATSGNTACIASDIMDREPLVVDAHARLGDVSRQVTGRARNRVNEDFIVTSEGQFLGIAQVSDLLRQITRML